MIKFRLSICIYFIKFYLSSILSWLKSSHMLDNQKLHRRNAISGHEHHEKRCNLQILLILIVYVPFFHLLFGCPTANFRVLSRGQLQSPKCNHSVLSISTRRSPEPSNKVRFRSPVEYLMGFEPRTFRLIKTPSPTRLLSHQEYVNVNFQLFTTFSSSAVQNLLSRKNKTVFSFFTRSTCKSKVALSSINSNTVRIFELP